MSKPPSRFGGPPVNLPSDWQPRWGYCLTPDVNPNDPTTFLAVISDGSPQYGQSPITVLDVEIVADLNEARRWYKETMRSKPWLPRQ